MKYYKLFTKIWIRSIDNNQLTGKIPENIGNLENLTTLYFFKIFYIKYFQRSLHNNKLISNIPTSIGNLKNLSILYF